MDTMSKTFQLEELMKKDTSRMSELAMEMHDDIIAQLCFDSESRSF